MRVTVAAKLLPAVVGFAVNDFGPVVLALALFWLGPLLAVLRAEKRPLAVTSPADRGRAAGRHRASPA